jgi:hypothetical protein
MSGIWTHRLLNALRQIGDPDLDCAPGDCAGWRIVAAAGNEEVGGRTDLDDRRAQADLLELWRSRELGALPNEKRLIEEITSADAGSRSLIEEYWSRPAAGVPQHRLAMARELFVEFGGEIGATLLLASLPNAYASAVGSAVLANTDELRSNTRRRIAETAQFVVEVLFPDSTLLYGDPLGGWDLHIEDQGVPRGSRGYIRVRTTRLTHAVIRTVISSISVDDGGQVTPRWKPDASAGIPVFQDKDDPDLHVLRGVPINQEDLLGTLATFTVTVFEVMERLGVAWNEEAEQAYLDLWNQVGELLGIGTLGVTQQLEAMGIAVPDDYAGSLRPKTPAEARALCELIRLRSWPLPLPGRVLGPFEGATGKLLVRSLLDELQAAMPRGMERVPLTVMRYLVDERAHELLGLGGGGVIEALLRLQGPAPVGRTPTSRLSRGIVQSGMRLAANDISRRAFVHFIREKAKYPDRPQFWFPGIPPRYTDLTTAGRTPPTDIPTSDTGP